MSDPCVSATVILGLLFTLARDIRVDGAARPDRVRARAARHHPGAGAARPVLPLDVGVVRVREPAAVPADVHLARRRGFAWWRSSSWPRRFCWSASSTRASPSCTNCSAASRRGAFARVARVVAPAFAALLIVGWSGYHFNGDAALLTLLRRILGYAAFPLALAAWVWLLIGAGAFLTRPGGRA